MSEKKILMIALCAPTYMDVEFHLWDYRCGSGTCVHCGEKKTNAYLFINRDDGSVICQGCTDDVMPAEMFKTYEMTQQLPEILARFNTTLINCEAEFKRHLTEKGDAWLQGGTDWLFESVQRASAKLLLAEKDFQLDKTLDLVLWAMMLAERDLRDADKDEDDIPF